MKWMPSVLMKSDWGFSCFPTGLQDNNKRKTGKYLRSLMCWQIKFQMPKFVKIFGVGNRLPVFIGLYFWLLKIFPGFNAWHYPPNNSLPHFNLARSLLSGIDLSQCIAWKFSRQLKFSVIRQTLSDGQQMFFGTSTEGKRSVNIHFKLAFPGLISST